MWGGVVQLMGLMQVAVCLQLVEQRQVVCRPDDQKEGRHEQAGSVEGRTRCLRARSQSEGSPASSMLCLSLVGETPSTFYYMSNCVHEESVLL